MSSAIINNFSPATLKKALQRNTKMKKEKLMQKQVEKFFEDYFEEFPVPKYEAEKALKRKERRSRRATKCH